VRARLQQGLLDVGFYLATSDELAQMRNPQGEKPALNPYLYEGNMASTHTAPAQSATKFIAKELTRFSYHVLAPAGWGPQVMGKDWRALAQLPWIITPAASAHHRLLQAVFQPLGIQPRRAALVDQEASMLDLVRSGVGLSLARDTLALREAQSRGLVIADRVQLECMLCFIHAAVQQQTPTLDAARRALEKVWN
jgi:DNA-binding transcriptional LysR family regulator